MRYGQHESFWTDKDGVLYRQGAEEQPCVVIPATLVHKVPTCYHDLPFTAHQGVKRTLALIGSKYWWKTLRDDVAEFIKRCYACAKRKRGHRLTAPLGEAVGVREFLDVVSLDVVGPLLLLREKIRIYLRLLITLPASARPFQ